VWVSITTPGWGSVGLSQFMHYPQRWISNSRGLSSILIHWSGPLLFLPWWSQPHSQLRVRGLLKALTGKNTPVRLEPATADCKSKPTELSWPHKELREELILTVGTPHDEKLNAGCFYLALAIELAIYPWRELPLVRWGVIILTSSLQKRSSASTPGGLSMWVWQIPSLC